MFIPRLLDLNAATATKSCILFGPRLKHLILVCQETTPRKLGSIWVLPWQEFLERLWGGAYPD